MTAAEFLPALTAINGEQPVEVNSIMWTATCPSCGKGELTVVNDPSHRPFCDAGCRPSDVEAMLRQVAPTAGISTGPTGPAVNPAVPPGGTWLESASDLLREPDPGPTPCVVEDLLVEQAVGAIQGPPKCGKTWVVTELAISVVTGRPAFGRFAVPQSGPVLMVLEESGRTALHRRLDLLRRGSATGIEELADLYFSANRRVRLDDPTWRSELIDAGKAIRPRVIFLDPLARLKGAGTDEDSQQEMAAVLDFMRDLRDQTGAAVVFVHHTGHAGGRMRGTSDLEAYWESKLSINREQGGVCTLKSEHREAEAGGELRYTLAWDEVTRSLRLSPVDGPSPSEQLADDLLDYLAEHPGGTLEEVRKGVRRRKSDVRSRLLALEEAGTACSKRSQRVGTNGNAYTAECWYPASGAGLQVVPLNGNTPDQQASGTPVVPTVPPSLEVGPGTGAPEGTA